MCNYSDFIYEKGVSDGEVKGEARGKAEALPKRPTQTASSSRQTPTDARVLFVVDVICIV